MTRPTICGERVALPAALADAALRLAAPHVAYPEDVERGLRCTLERHDLGDHHSFVMELPGYLGAVWARWARGNPPVEVVALLDCPIVSPPPRSEPCCEFEAHQGAHSWQMQ